MGVSKQRIQECCDMGRDTFRFTLASIETRRRKPLDQTVMGDEEIEKMMVDIRLESRDHADDMVYQGNPYGPHADEIVKWTGEERMAARAGVMLGFYLAERAST